MKRSIRTLVCGVVAIQASLSLGAATLCDQSFDSDWRFLRGDVSGAENPAFDDSGWRKLDVPHDWSIEDLPPQTNAVCIGPFTPGKGGREYFTGYTVGGIGWYRKHFTVSETNKLVVVRFDGIYMNPEIWINGQRLGEHPYGYTSFEFDLTPYLKPPRQENVLAVRVRNEGRNSRWYSGSGIYRHVWLTVTEPVHAPTWGLFVTTPEVSNDKALVKVVAEVTNASNAATSVLVRANVLNAIGKVVNTADGKLDLPSHETRSVEQSIEVRSPKLWSPDSPNLYSVQVQIVVAGKIADVVSTSFGIRKIEADAEHGFRLNGQALKLKGGCVHIDNGPLGSPESFRRDDVSILSRQKGVIPVYLDELFPPRKPF